MHHNFKSKLIENLRLPFLMNRLITIIKYKIKGGKCVFFLVALTQINVYIKKWLVKSSDWLMMDWRCIVLLLLLFVLYGRMKDRKRKTTATTRRRRRSISEQPHTQETKILITVIFSSLIRRLQGYQFSIYLLHDGFILLHLHHHPYYLFFFLVTYY